MTEPRQRKPRVSVSRTSTQFWRCVIMATVSAGFMISGCDPMHTIDLYVQNASSKPISVKITGIHAPWNSHPISPGGRQLVDRPDWAWAGEIQVTFFDSASGRQLLTESL